MTKHTALRDLSIALALVSLFQLAPPQATGPQLPDRRRRTRPAR